MALRVQEALDSVNGDQHQRLLALGPEAVPAICDQLGMYDHPYTLIGALTEFQDDRATLPLLEFLDAKPGAARPIVWAFREIGDPRAEPALLRIVNDESVFLTTRYEATVALARLGSPQVKAWAWEEITRIYKTREGDLGQFPWSDAIDALDISRGLCEVLTEEADIVIAGLLRPHGAFAGPLRKRAETRDRKRIVNTYLHLAEHEGREEDGYEGRHEVYYQNVAALWFLHDMGGVVPTHKMLDIMATLERRHPELAAPIEAEDQSLDQVVTWFQQLKETLHSEPTVKLYRHPMTRKEELLNYLWCYEFQHASIRDYVTERDRALLIEMLADPACNNAWWNIPMVLGVLGEDEDAYNALLHYIQRPGEKPQDLNPLPWVSITMNRRIEAVSWLPMLNHDKGAKVLVDIMESQESANEFLKEWPYNEDSWTPGYSRAFNGRFAKLRGSAALGLVLVDRNGYTPIVRRAFDRAHTVVWENKVSEYADAQGDEAGGLHYALCHKLATALAVAEYLESHTPDDFWAISWRERTFDPSKRAGEIIREASQARAAGEDSVAAVNVPKDVPRDPAAVHWGDAVARWGQKRGALRALGCRLRRRQAGMPIPLCAFGEDRQECLSPFAAFGEDRQECN